MLTKATINSLLAAMHLGPSAFSVNSLYMGLTFDPADHYNPTSDSPPASINGYRRIPVVFSDFTFISSTGLYQNYFTNNYPLGFKWNSGSEWICGSDGASKTLAFYATPTAGTPIWIASLNWGTTQNRVRSGTTLVFTYSSLIFDTNGGTQSNCFQLGQTTSRSLTAALLANNSPFLVSSTYLSLHSSMYNPLNSTSYYEINQTSYQRQGVSAWTFDTTSFTVRPTSPVIFNSVQATTTIAAIGMWNAPTGGDLIWAARVNSVALSTGDVPFLPSSNANVSSLFTVGLI